MSEPEVVFVGDKMYVPYAEYKTLASRTASLWRVVWNLAGTKSPRQTLEFPQEDKAMEWANGLLKGGANGIVVTELMVGKTIRIDADNPAALQLPEKTTIGAL